MPNYGDQDYWENRYQEYAGTQFDWLEDYESLKELLIEQVSESKKDRILVLGCGNAQFSADMYDDGYHNIVNIDYSKVCIDQMSAINKERSKMEYHLMDVRDLKFEDNSFDIAIDKSTIDALLCGNGATVNTAIMMKEVQRVLKPGGIYFCISYGKPESRTHHMEHEFLNFSIREFALYPVNCSNKIEKEEKTHYVYICKKLDGADEKCQTFYEQVIRVLKKEQELEELLEQERNDSDDPDPINYGKNKVARQERPKSK